ncbi:MAG: tandem-95 repeat protein [Deltaproteobacteria bacterium]|nr:tandem-95 repeat protein [Deltaproteobacteria bacterium]
MRSASPFVVVVVVSLLGCFDAGLPAAAVITCVVDADCSDQTRCLAGSCVGVDVEAPGLAEVNFSTREDTPMVLALAAVDVDAGAARITAVQPSSGVLDCGPSESGTACVVTPATEYRPAADFVGTDAFEVVVENTAIVVKGRALSTTVLVQVTVTAENDAPRFLPQADVSVDVDEGAAVLLFLPELVSDVDGDELTVGVVASGVGATVDGRVLTITAPGLPGTGTVVVTASDAGGAAAVATLDVVVLPVNDPPSATRPALLRVSRSSTAASFLEARDEESTTLTLALRDPPADLTLAPSSVDVAAGVDLLITAADDAVLGRRTLTLVISDGEASVEVPVDVDVLPALLADAQLVDAREDTAVEITLTGSAPSASFSFDIDDTGLVGSISQDGAVVVFQPAPELSGETSFSFVVVDGVARSAPATVTITVAPVDDAPVLGVSRVDAEVIEEGSLDVDVIAAFAITDADGDVVVPRLVSDDDDGLVLLGDIATFVPAQDFFGTRRFFFAFDDDADGSAGERDDGPLGELVITVVPVNDAPLALSNPEPELVDEDDQGVIFLDAVDFDDDPLAFTVGDPSHGSLDADARQLSRGVVVYRPEENFHGVDGFDFFVDDGLAPAVAGRVEIVVASVNDAPVVVSTVVRHGPARPGVAFEIPIVATAVAPAELDPAVVHVVDVDLALDPSEVVDVDVLSGGFGPVVDRCGSLLYTPIDQGAQVVDDALVLTPRDRAVVGNAAAVRIELTSLPTCAHLLTAGVATVSGVYLLDPGEPGGSDRFSARCDMETAGGGFTEVLRVDGNLPTFSFNATFWASSGVDFGSVDGGGEARLPAYTRARAGELLLQFDGRTPLRATLPQTRTLAEHIESSGRVQLDADPADGLTDPLRWTVATGIDLAAGCDDGAGPVRIGTLCGADVLGVGFATIPTAGANSLSAASLGMFTTVWVRDREFTDLPGAPTCDDHLAAGALLSGSYLVDGLATFCDFGERRSVCGDGFEDEPIDCDDGETNDGGACTSQCVPNVCGDGIAAGLDEFGFEEVCDDGNLVDDDGCQPDCTPDCGDGELDPGETCELGDLDCHAQCGFCGDDVCDQGIELNETCGDCFCGDGVCQISEQGRRIPRVPRDLLTEEPLREALPRPLPAPLPLPTPRCLADCGSCGDQICGAGEDTTECREDCSVCGDGICAFDEEECIDCLTCGDGDCQNHESTAKCVLDCGSACGDAACNGDETALDCPQDCTRCDDEVCGPGESAQVCPNDCSALCGDGACAAQELLTRSCPDDCVGQATFLFCGDGVCAGEDPVACPADCGSGCGDGFCTGGEFTGNCVADCGFCGDGVCGSEDGLCGDCAVCGDGLCGDTERLNCELDCPQCANGACGAGCGDGITQSENGEQCDDGNLSYDDDCTPVCTLSICGDGMLGPNEDCDDNTGACVDCAFFGCGDGVLEGEEQCDDANRDNGDGCDSACRLEACGNGFLQADEECDDGNDVDDDGCRSSCATPFCGDGATATLLNEGCDDGNLDPGDGCDPTCQTEACGNGVHQPALNEECDDGDADESDDCSDACTLTFCGDNLVQVHRGEQCEDGNFDNDDGCSNACRFEVCGDGALQPDEECDDGNTLRRDGCGPTCSVESCGNGILDPDEECDDGDDFDCNGCNDCVIEL